MQHGTLCKPCQGRSENVFMSSLQHGTTHIPMSRMCSPKYDSVGQCDVRWLTIHELTACSLQCSRYHKDQCAGHDTRTANGVADNDMADEKATGRGAKGPASVNTVPNAPEIQRLFTIYPNLKGQLRNIYEASQQTACYHGMMDACRGQGDHQGHQSCPQVIRDQRSTQKGLEGALTKLSWHLDSTAGGSKGLAIFCETVSNLLESRSSQSQPTD